MWTITIVTAKIYACAYANCGGQFLCRNVLILSGRVYSAHDYRARDGHGRGASAAGRQTVTHSGALSICIAVAVIDVSGWTGLA